LIYTTNQAKLINDCFTHQFFKTQLYIINVKSILLFLLPVYLFLVSEASYARHAAIVIDADTGNILHEVEANQPWYPASLT